MTKGNADEEIRLKKLKIFKSLNADTAKNLRKTNVRQSM